MSGTITITGPGADDAINGLDEWNKKVILKNCKPFIDCTRKINNTQIDHSKDLVAVMPIYNLIECSHNFSKTSGSLWQYYRHDPTPLINNSESFKSKIIVTGKPPQKTLPQVIQEMLK